MASGRRPYSNKAQAVFEVIKNNPGIKRSTLMRKLGYDQTKGADALLASLERDGNRISEDDEGRLYPWSLWESEKGVNCEQV